MEVGEGSEDLAAVEEEQEGGTVAKEVHLAVVDEAEGGVTGVEAEGPAVVVVEVGNVEVDIVEVSVDVDWVTRELEEDTVAE